jgi:xanthine dehydrogenase molybdenum-binding subunit
MAADGADVKKQVQFTLNGKAVSCEVEKGESMLEVLRDRFDVTSPKDGCAPQGQCGCCTVLIDGRALMACIQDAEKLEGKELQTLEGIDQAERDTLAQAFLEADGMQCGYCIPGIVMKAKQILDKNPSTDRETIAKQMNANLCRCTGYAKVLDAIELAGTRWEQAKKGEVIRADVDRNDFGVGGKLGRYRGPELSLGDKDYINDMQMEGLLHGALVFSPHARAKIEKIDLSEAEASPGVERIFTARDVPGKRTVGLIVKDWPVFIAEGETTHCVGDVLAVVVAKTRRQARAAAEKVAVQCEVLDPITDPHASLKEGAPVIHPHLREDNLLATSILKRGDLDEAKKRATHVVKHTFQTQRIEHAFLEPESCLALPEDGHLRVYSQGQGVHDDQKQLSQLLDLPLEEVQVSLVSCGGAFGGKEDLSVQGHTALCAHLMQAPVRITLTRDESIRLHPKRHPIEMTYEMGADDDGKIQFIHARMIGDTGAYASVGMKVLERAAGHSCGPYAVPAVDVEALTVYTNNVPCGAFRGFGANQAAFALETMVDLIAEKVGIDGYDIRERNILDAGGEFATGQLLDESCGIRQTLEAVKDDFKNAKYAGIACGIKNTGIGNGMPDIGRVLIHVDDENTVTAYTGFTEMGQGLFTILQQVVCEESGLSPDQIRVEVSTDFAVECGMTTASRATVLAGKAGQFAGEKLGAALKEKSLSDLVGQTFEGEYICDFTTKLGATNEANPVTHLTFGYATQVVILDDDGKLAKVIAAHDVGKAINPRLCEGQVEGGVAMGLGYALTEDLPCVDGAPFSTKINDLGLLRAKHMPEIDVRLVEVPDKHGAYGAKGVGEIGLVPTAPAVASALYAFDKKRRFKLPMRDSAAAHAILPARLRE